MKEGELQKAEEALRTTLSTLEATRLAGECKDRDHLHESVSLRSEAVEAAALCKDREERLCSEAQELELLKAGLGRSRVELEQLRSELSRAQAGALEESAVLRASLAHAQSEQREAVSEAGARLSAFQELEVRLGAQSSCFREELDALSMVTAKKDEILDGRESELRLVHAELKKAIMESETFQDCLGLKDSELKQAQDSLLKQDTELKSTRAELATALKSLRASEVQLQAKDGEMSIANTVIEGMRKSEQDHRLTTVQKERDHLHEITRARAAAQGELDVANKHAEILKERVLDLEVALHRGQCMHLVPLRSDVDGGGHLGPSFGSGLAGAGSASMAEPVTAFAAKSFLDEKCQSMSPGAVPSSLPPLGVQGPKDVSLAARARPQSAHGGASTWQQPTLGSGALPTSISPLHAAGLSQAYRGRPPGAEGAPSGGNSP